MAADPRVSKKGRLITLAVFGGLFLLAVIILWLYVTRVETAESGSSGYESYHELPRSHFDHQITA